MDQRSRKSASPPDLEQVALGELIHHHVRAAIETAVHEELDIALGVRAYERYKGRRGYRNGRKTRTLRDRAARWHSRCRGRRCSVGASGRQRCCPAINGGCLK